MERIVSTLSTNHSITIDDMIELQNDSYSSFAASLTPHILEIINNQQEYDFSLPISYLENWDYKYTQNSTAASIFDAFFINFTKNTLLDEFGEAAFEHFSKHELIPVRTMTELLQNSSSF